MKFDGASLKRPKIAHRVGSGRVGECRQNRSISNRLRIWSSRDWSIATLTHGGASLDPCIATKMRQGKSKTIDIKTNGVFAFFEQRKQIARQTHQRRQ